MSVSNIAIIGAGGIGQRHLQSCCDLPGNFKMFVVDPSEEALANAQRLAREKGRQTDVTWLVDLAKLPSMMDMAIIATRADIRAQVVHRLLDRAVIRNMILEKVLFQTLPEYGDINSALSKFGVKAWVNCPGRTRSGNHAIRDWIGSRSVRSISVRGANWDIGCNAIHYLDLFAFLLDWSSVEISDVDLLSAVPAKRNGMLHIEGALRGTITRKIKEKVSFSISSLPECSSEREVEIICDDGIVRSEEGADRMTVSIPNEAVKVFPIPFQSQMTSGLVQEILSSELSNLPTYDESRRLHEPLLSAFLGVLAERSLLPEKGRCPVT